MAGALEGRLIATDLDGTLLRSDLSVSDRSRRALAAAHRAGAIAVFVSARPPRAIRHIAESLGLDGLAICSNGAVLYDLSTDSVLEEMRLSAETARGFVSALSRAAPGLLFAAEYGGHVANEPGFPGEGAFREVSPDRIVSAASLCSASMVKLVAHHPHHAVDALFAQVETCLGAAASVTHSGASFVEVAAPGVSKSAGLATLCRRLGIAPAQVVAFGDMPNDVMMLRLAGHGVAVANAHAEVLAAADEVTASNDDDGVAMVIERLLAAV